MSRTDTFLWYDFETFGVDTRRDRPVQFAAIRTDMNLNVVDDPIDIICRPAADCLPDPTACLITGISPLKALETGLPEKEFADQIFNQMSMPSTCTLGYNTIRFDDEVTRFMFYRNLIDPYQREWKMGNSRWDLLDVVRMTWALKPETLHWPLNENGQVSFKLDRLTPANGIGHENAHDALSDVRATIELARMIKTGQPELFDYAFGLRNKNVVSKKLDLLNRKPVLHISGRFPVEQGCMAMVVPIAKLPDNANGIICFNLSQSPDILTRLTVEEIQYRLFSTRDALEESGLERIGLKVIHINKSPMIVPAAMLTAEIAQKFGHDLDVIHSNYEAIKSLPDLSQILSQVFQRQFDEDSDVDVQLYQEFISNQDRARLNDVREWSPFSASIKDIGFQDKRLPELLFRYWCRNWPEQIPEQFRPVWQEWCRKALTESNFGAPRTVASVKRELEVLRKSHSEYENLWSDFDKFLTIQQQLIAIS